MSGPGFNRPAPGPRERSTSPQSSSALYSVQQSIHSSTYHSGGPSSTADTSSAFRSSLSGWSGSNHESADFDFGEGTSEGTRRFEMDNERPVPCGPNGTKVKPFIQKLAFVLSKPELFGDVLRWDATGTSFILSHTAPRLVATVLPQVWGHSNLSSFSRQLGVYNFSRLQPSELAMLIDVTHSLALPLAEYSGYTNPYFLRSDDTEMYRLRPKPTAARQLKKDEKKSREALNGTSGAGGSGSGGIGKEEKSWPHAHSGAY